MKYMAMNSFRQIYRLCNYGMISILIIMAASTVIAQTDAFGEIDELYIDSVITTPGTNIEVRFYMKNDEPISSVSIPITYDETLLELTSISFAGSRIDYIPNKIISPSEISTISGHFLISSFVVFEEPVPPGNGHIFSAFFNVSDSAQIGQQSLIDTLFFPPGGEMIFVEASQSIIIIPKVISGAVIIDNNNFTPTILTIPDQNLFEGDSLSLSVTANDANKDNLTLVCLNKPAGAIFIDDGNGSGQLKWAPDFIGPYSSDGSPFTATFRVSDGNSFSEEELVINVINSNRKPVLTGQLLTEASSGEFVTLEIEAFDPDFDLLNFNLSGLPENAVFITGKPNHIEWQTQLTDTGSFVITTIASDPGGYSDTIMTEIYLSPTAVYELKMDEVEGFPGDVVNFSVTLDNLFPVGSYNLLLHYDPTALTVVAVTNEATRAAQFDNFDFENNTFGVAGDLRITAEAGSAEILPVGTGPVVNLQFRISSDISFSGIQVPVRFIYKDLNQNDNTLTDTNGVRINQEAIVYTHGSVNILSYGQVRVGDINLNGIAFDIGDAIYFSNYFMDPINFPMNPLQYVNSDVNNDLLAATIADLVTMIRIITEGGFTAKFTNTEAAVAEVYESYESDYSQLGYKADFEIGAILVKIETESGTLNQIVNLTDNMTMDYVKNDNQIKVLFYSLDGHSLPSGEFEFLRLDGFEHGRIEIELATSEGQMVELSKNSSELLPENFVLHQNYPNPFNPETRIEFELPATSEVRLTVYNLLGEKVNVIINEILSAGVHSVVWNSRNDDGREVASGVYLYRLETNERQLSKKMMLLK